MSGFTLELLSSDSSLRVSSGSTPEGTHVRAMPVLARSSSAPGSVASTDSNPAEWAHGHHRRNRERSPRRTGTSLALIQQNVQESQRTHTENEVTVNLMQQNNQQNIQVGVDPSAVAAVMVEATESLAAQRVQAVEALATQHVQNVTDRATEQVQTLTALANQQVNSERELASTALAQERERTQTALSQLESVMHRVGQLEAEVLEVAV